MIWNHRAATYDRIGRLENTGTGEVGTGYDNPRVGDVLVPSGSGFPDRTTTDVYTYDNQFERLEVDFPSSSQISRVGVFYSTVSYNGNTHTISTIKISASGMAVGYTVSLLK